MEPIYSMTMLQKNPSVVKEDARKGIVRITEHGKGAYVFCSEEVFEERLARERADAADFEARLFASVDRGIKDLEEGRYVSVSTPEELDAVLAARRANRG